VSPLEYLERGLHPWVSFVVMPVFALANAGVAFHPRDVTDPVAVAVAAGLVVGKPVGIVVASWLAVRTGVARLPAGVGWGALAGAGLLAGITREFLFEVGPANGIDVQERVLRDDDLFEAEEAFLTSTTREIVPITTVDDRAIGSGKPGPITDALLAAFRKAARSDIAARTQK